VIYKGGGSDAVYGLGILGAWFYYITTAPDFLAGVVGVIKGIFWPGFVVFELLKFFGM
jgi:hypothetical protein